MKKQCSKCKELKDLSMFHKDKGGELGVYASCKLCRKLVSQKYWEGNKEKIYKRSRKWVSENRDWVYNYKKDYAEKNKELIRSWARDYVKRNKNIVYARGKTYRESNRDMINGKKRLLVKNLGDSYIKQKLCRDNILSHKDIPQEMVEARRQYMKLNRIIRKES